MKWTVEFLFWWTPRRKKDAENKVGLKRCIPGPDRRGGEECEVILTPLLPGSVRFIP